MKALILLLVAVAISAQETSNPCKVKFNSCSETWVAKAAAAGSDEEKCAAATRWRKCLSEAAAEDGCGNNIPDTLAQEEETYCNQDDSEECKSAQEKCKKEWKQGDDSDKCHLAKAWRTCVEDAIATGNCEEVPEEVAAEQSKSCKSGDVGTECQEEQDKCRATWEAKYSDFQPSAVKCHLATDWEKCVDSASRSPACQDSVLEASGELTMQQAYCFVEEDPEEDCEGGEAVCADAWSPLLHSARDDKQRCDAALSWQACMSAPELTDQCPSGVDFPEELQVALATYCYDDIAAGTNSCTEKEAGCGTDHQVPKDATSKVRCENAKSWRGCIEDLQAQGCDLVVPIAIEVEEERYCTDTESCPVRIAQCKVHFDKSDSGVKQCDQAKKWRSCLEKLLGICHFDRFPRELDVLEASSCYGQTAMDCLGEQTKCRAEYHDKVKATGETCALVQEWRSCLLNLAKEQKCIFTFPKELDIAEANNCYGAQAGSSCGDKQAKCKKAFDDAAPGSDECQNAKTWRSCLEALMRSCRDDLTFPMELNVAEASSCYGGSGSRGSSKGADGAPVSCKDRQATCKHDSVVSPPRGISRCGQARQWRSCLEGLFTDCLDDLVFPAELDKLEAHNCYGKGSSDDRKGQGDSGDKDQEDRDQSQGGRDKDQKDRDQSHGGRDKGQDKGGDNTRDQGNDCTSRAARCKPRRTKKCADAKVWRKCLDRIKDECGMGIYTMQLNTLQATKC